MSGTYTCECGAEYATKYEGHIPSAIHECALCWREVCEDGCQVLLANCKGEQRPICEECRDKMIPATAKAVIDHLTVRLQQAIAEARELRALVGPRMAA